MSSSRELMQEMVALYSSAASVVDAPDQFRSVVEKMRVHLQNNATFYTFKPSGKWYTTERGYLSRDIFHGAKSGEEKVERIRADNGGAWPGLRGTGSEFTLVVFGDEDLDYGFPLMIVRPPWR